jgi:GxxExxY protein
MESMPYEGEDPPYAEPDPELDALASAVIGAAIEVHRQMGPGLDEVLYHNGLCVELRQRGIPFVRNVEVPVLYKGELIGKRFMDLLVGGRLVVELKAVEASPRCTRPSYALT